jgi:hypothetical protein
MEIDDNTAFTRHRILPMAMGHRVNFTIPIPYGCGKVTGIFAVATLGLAATNALKALAMPPTQAGMLSLRLRGPGDIFFQAPVPSGIAWEENNGIARITSPEHPLGIGVGLWAAGVRFHGTDIEVGTNHKAIAAYYVDSANLRAGKTEQYTVDIFVRFEKRP